MTPSEILTKIRTAIATASGLAETFVVFDGEPLPGWLPADSVLVRLNTTALAPEGDPRTSNVAAAGVGAGALPARTRSETSYVFTVTAKFETIVNPGLALATALATRNGLANPVNREVWRNGGLAVVSLPLRPSPVNYTSDNRAVSAFAIDATFRAVILTDVTGQVPPILSAHGTGELTNPTLSIPFEAHKV